MSFESSALSPLCRHDGAQSRRARLHRPPRQRSRARRQHARVADAAGRHRPRARTPGRRLCASCARRPISASVQRLGEIAEWLDLRYSARARRATPGTANTAARNRSGSRCALPGTKARSISRIRPAATNRNSWNGAGSRLQNLPDLVVPFKRKVYERVVRGISEIRRAAKRKSAANGCPTSQFAPAIARG